MTINEFEKWNIYILPKDEHHFYLYCWLDYSIIEFISKMREKWALSIVDSDIEINTDLSMKYFGGDGYLFSNDWELCWEAYPGFCKKSREEMEKELNFEKLVNIYEKEFPNWQKRKSLIGQQTMNNGKKQNVWYH